MKPAELAGKSTADLAAILAQKISDSAIEQLASAGVPAAQLPKVTATEARTSAELLADYNKITDPAARAAFYSKNKQALFGGKN